MTTSKKWKTTSKKMEDNLKKIKNGRRPQNKMEDEPINLIGCETIVNSPSYVLKIPIRWKIIQFF